MISTLIVILPLIQGDLALTPALFSQISPIFPTPNPIVAAPHCQEGALSVA